MVPLYLMPQSFRGFADALSDEMSSAAAGGVLRWRSRTLGLPQPFASGEMRWRFGNTDDWQMLPRDIYVSIHGASRLELSDGAAPELQDLLTRHELEPLAHELFREAWGQREDNPRSSLLLGMAAREIGVNNYIADCVPDAEWLAENVPTPPFLRMLQEYLPTLHPEGGTPIAPPDKDTVNVLKVAVTLRNGLAHTGSDVPRERLAKTLRAVRNVLWRMDVARGHAWASDYITSLEEDLSEGYRRTDRRASLEAGGGDPLSRLRGTAGSRGGRRPATALDDAQRRAAVRESAGMRESAALDAPAPGRLKSSAEPGCGRRDATTIAGQDERPHQVRYTACAQWRRARINITAH